MKFRGDFCSLTLPRFGLQTKLYQEDWIGLKALDEAGRVKFVSVPGGHLGISNSDMRKHIVPYLKDKPSVSASLAATWHAVGEALGLMGNDVGVLLQSST